MAPGPQIGDFVIGGRYQLLRQVKGCPGLGRTHLGAKGCCRFCGRRGQSRFRNTAHTFPEGIGNDWIISLDECDDCNRTFMRYDDAIANAISPFLTLGGIRGKDNKVRQTGRSTGHAVIQRRQAGELPSIHIALKDVGFRNFTIDPATGLLEMMFPVADVRFRPRHAYKALCKMGVALLPDVELDNFQRLRAWLLDVDDDLDFSNLEVAMSFAWVGQELPLVGGSLLRRFDPTGLTPYMLFVLTAGSICLQIDLMPDTADDHLPPMAPGQVKIEWRNIVGDETGAKTVTIPYGQPVHLNWASREPAPQPVEFFALEFSSVTSRGRLTPLFRPNP